MACNKQTPSHIAIVTEYYEAFNSSDFKRIHPLVADSITIIEGDYVMPYSKESLHEQFRWDSVFQPTYEIVEAKEENDHVMVTVASSSIRYRFLENDPLTTKFRVSFANDLITKLEVVDYVDPDWNIWQQKRDTLVKWVQDNHPALDGFVHDLSMNGALNYVQAIEHYENMLKASDSI